MMIKFLVNPNPKEAAQDFKDGMAEAFDNFFEGLSKIKRQTEIQVINNYIPDLEIYQFNEKWHWNFRSAKSEGASASPFEALADFAAHITEVYDNRWDEDESKG